MKRILPILSIVVVMAACTNSTKTTAVPQVQAPDTTGLAQFQNWKAQNELADAGDYNQPENKLAEAPQKQAKKSGLAPLRKRKHAAPAPKSATANHSTASNNHSTASNESVMTSESADAAKAPVKKGISKAAKGAIIGAAGGAAAGAVLNKNNRVVGAVIGAVVGAGGGYVIGRKMDKKDGRYLTPGITE